MKHVLQIIEDIKNLEINSSSFGSIRNPRHNYLFIPQMSSQRREYIPIGF